MKVGVGYDMREKADMILKVEKRNHSVILIDIENYSRLVNMFGLMFVDSAMECALFRLQETMKNRVLLIDRVSESSYFALMNEIDDTVIDDIKNTLDNCYFGEKSGKVIPAVYRIGTASGEFEGIDDALEKTGKAVATAQKQNKNVADYKVAVPDIVPVKQKQYIPYNRCKYDTEFMAFAASLLAHAISIKSSVNLLLGMAGVRYDVQSVLINEYNSKTATMNERHIWSKKDGVVAPTAAGWAYNEWDGFMQGFDRRGFMAINDTSVGFSEKDKAFFEMKGIKATINCLLYSGTRINGYISFCDCERTREWTEYEKLSIYELSNMIAAFLSKQNNETEDRKTIEQLSRDSLTGLMTMQSFMHEAQRQYNEADKDSICAITYADINNFAYVNENFGYFEGNKILTMFADKMREYPQTSCRISADRFLTFRICTDKKSIVDDVQYVNDYINQQLRKRFPASDLRISTGIYFLNPDDDIQSGIEKANVIRKMIKSDRSKVCDVYTEELSSKKKLELEIIGSVHNAIESGEIVAFLQPKYSLTTNNIIGAEALVRWRKPDGTMMSPGQFVPLLERVGYIVDVDYCVYEQVLKCCARWKEEGKTLIPISVNFSRKHTNNPDFVENICELAEKYGIDKKYIEIEITESTISDNHIMLDYIGRLRKHGFKVDIDDFGTGYSSLDMLMDVPVDIVKIDKRFIDKSDSEKGRAYIKQVADLVLASRKDIIFEGVETQNQADFLKDSGYSKIQGYYFDGPLPIEEFEKKYMQ